MPYDFHTQMIEEFRANRGRIAMFADEGRRLLLTTTGARSGRPHTTILGYVPDEGGRLLVIGSAAGADKHPDWYHNVRVNPQVTIEDGIFTYPAVAEVLAGEERDRIFARIVEALPGYGDYQLKTSRVLPVVALRNAQEGPPMMGSFGETLKAIHDAFRRELASIRAEVAEAGPRLGAQLRVNCLAVCGGLHIHHRGEDLGIFPAVLRQRPDLEPVVERLRAEHETVARLIAELETAVRTENPLPQVERLIAELEAHLRYEEEMIIPALSAPA